MKQLHYTLPEIRAYLAGEHRERLKCVLMERHLTYCDDCRSALVGEMVRTV